MRRIEKLEIKVIITDWPFFKYENLPPNIKELAIVSDRLGPKLGLFDDQGNFIKEINLMMRSQGWLIHEAGGVTHYEEPPTNLWC